MSLITILCLLIAGWLAVAAAMLWGVLRIARRHHHPHPIDAPQAKPAKAPRRRWRTLPSTRMAKSMSHKTFWTR